MKFNDERSMPILRWNEPVMGVRGLRGSVVWVVAVCWMVSLAWFPAVAVAEEGSDADATVRAHEIDPGDYVLVYLDAPIFEVPDDSERTHQGFESDREAAESITERKMIVSVVADHGSFVEVEHVPRAEQLPCGHQTLRRDAPVDLRFFVRRSDLIPTVSQPVDYRYDDGIRVEILPGQDLIARQESLEEFRTGARDFELSFAPKPKHLTLGFPLHEDNSRSCPSGKMLRVDTDTEIPLGPHILELDGDSGSVVVPVVDEPEDGDHLVKFESACIRLHARIEQEAVDSRFWRGVSCCGPGISPGVSTRFSGDMDIYDAEPETKVYWPDGGVAGEVAETISILGSDIDEDDEWYCDTTELMDEASSHRLERASESKRTVEYCLDVEDLQLR